MNKQENRLTISVLTTLIAGIALIYTLIQYHDLLFVVAGMSILFLIAAFFLTQNLIAFSLMRNKSLDVHLKGYVDDISTQLEALGEAQSQIGKANYVYTKQAAQTLATLDSNYTESQNALFKNLAAISNVQNKATKLNIKYDLDNTTKIIAAIKESRNQLNDTMMNGFDHIQPDNTDVIAVLTDIVNYLKTQTNGMNQGMELQLNNVAHELQNISSSIQQVQVQGAPLTVPLSTPVQPAPYADMTNPSSSPADVSTNGQTIPDTAQTTTSPTADLQDPSNTEEITTLLEDIHTLMTENTEGSVEPEIPTAAATTSPMETEAEAPIAAETAPIEAEAAAPITVEAAPIEAEAAAPITVEATPIEAEAAAPIAVEAAPIEVESTLPMETDTAGSAEETIDLPAEATAAPDTETADETESEAFTPTFTVVENPAPAEPVATAPNPADANKMLSPDEIAALFAAQSPEEPANTAPEPTPVDAAPELAPAEPVATAPNPADANKMLSPDEIAALFAAQSPEEPANTAPEPVPVDSAPEPAPAEPVATAPNPADANKMLSPDEIAALFASMG